MLHLLTTQEKSATKIMLTPSQYKKVVPLLCCFSKHSHHKQIEHDTFSQHPAEYTQKEVVKQSCYSSAEPLRENSTVCLLQV